VSIQQSAVVSAQEFELELPSGRFHAQSFGNPDGHLVLFLPGLSANMKGFDFLCERLVRDDLRLVAVDLRGRGLSEVTPPGTYGWVNHAKDVFAIADALGAPRFSLVGMSMGGAVAMVCAWMDAPRVERIVLLDMCGAPDEAANAPILAAVSRLGAVYPSVEAYLALVRQIGTVEPWSEYWERYFRYELEEVDGGVTARSNPAAVMEDGVFGGGAFAFGDDAGVYALWRSLTMPVLLLRASRELLAGFGRIVSDRDRERFPRVVRSATVVDVDANHYGINTHEDSARAIAAFLGGADLAEGEALTALGRTGR
jgi:pimeloyl-ACP methyl ester carboxylesterase